MIDLSIFETKMREAGLSPEARAAFHYALESLSTGQTGMLPETSLLPVEKLPDLSSLVSEGLQADPTLPGRTGILKLNGGLGTGMGLEYAKSLLEVRPGKTFLDLTGDQIRHLRTKTGTRVPLFLLNSFSTSCDTLAWLTRNPDLGAAGDIELLQNKIPKIDVASMLPVTWPPNPELEWCPPGHGDLYPVLASEHRIEKLVQKGIRYLFVSNSDNLGATLDPVILTWFAQSGAPFAMEVTKRTESDRKGGHLARTAKGFVLRESAQCPDSDLVFFQDITRHRFFNTNNLWLDLEQLEPALRSNGGFLPLPVIQNRKTVDPRLSDSSPVLQLETAMGAAIQCFPDAAAIDVPRSRFAPVKTTADLLALRSDAYSVGSDGVVSLAECRAGTPPAILLDSSYKLVDTLENTLSDGIPSLIECRSLAIQGPFHFSENTVFKGDVRLKNSQKSPFVLPPGVYADTEFCAP